MTTAVSAGMSGALPAGNVTHGEERADGPEAGLEVRMENDWVKVRVSRAAGGEL